MLQTLQNIAKFQSFQLDNLVDFEKCYKTPIYLQRSAPIQPKTSEILPKIWQKLATTLRVRATIPSATTAPLLGRGPGPLGRPLAFSPLLVSVHSRSAANPAAGGFSRSSDRIFGLHAGPDAEEYVA